MVPFTIFSFHLRDYPPNTALHLNAPDSSVRLSYHTTVQLEMVYPSRNRVLLPDLSFPDTSE